MRSAITVVLAGGSIQYVDAELAQDVCANPATPPQRLGISSEPSLTSAQSPFATGLSSTGRLTSAAHTSKFYGQPLIAWTPAFNADIYEVQYSKTAYPFKPEVDPRSKVKGFLTFSTSDVLPLSAGTWYYRVRGIDYNLPTGVQQMSWSDAGEARCGAAEVQDRAVRGQEAQVQDRSVSYCRRVNADLAYALELADAADALTLPRFRASDLHIETKPDLTPVTDADRATERMLRERIARDRPGESVFGEEEGDDGGAVRWIVDPIDGTRNFSRGIPVWATLIALEREGELVLRRRLGARARAPLVGGPRRGRVRRTARRSASRSRGSSSDATVSCTYGRDLARLEPLVWHARGLGDFWQHVLVAEGALDAAVDAELALWDYAALEPIVIEAGGRLGDFASSRSSRRTAWCTTRYSPRSALDVARATTLPAHRAAPHRAASAAADRGCRKSVASMRPPKCCTVNGTRLPASVVAVPVRTRDRTSTRRSAAA